jgi:hypothetical protein
MSVASLITMGLGNVDRVNGMVKDGFASYTGLAEPPANGFQYITAASPVTTNYSLAQGAVPAVVDGDVFIANKVTVPSSYAIVMFADGTVDINSAFDTSRQSFLYNIYRVSGNSVDALSTVWVNEVAPIWDDVVFLDNQIVGYGITVVDLPNSGYVHSPSGDTMTFAISSGALPIGMSLSSGGVLSGTPAFIGAYNFKIRATDITGASTESAAGQIYVTDLPTDTDVHDGGTHVVRESHYNRRKREKIKAAKLAKQRKVRTPEQIAADESVLAEYLIEEAAHIEKLTHIALNMIGSLEIH